eukprot:scaffold149163_cov21-Tisochrysis_lutea.AAC.1
MASQTEVGRLQTGFDEGGFDHAFRGDGSDGGGDDDVEDNIYVGVVLWLEDAQGSEDAEDASTFATEPGSEAEMQ